MSGESSTSKDGHYNNNEREPLLMKSNTALGGTTQQKDKFPAKRNNDNHYQSISEVNNNNNNNRHSYLPTTSSTMASIISSPTTATTEEQEEENNRIDQCRFKLFVILMIILTFSFVTSLSILLIAPGFAQKQLEDGFQLTFTEASILNITDQLQQHPSSTTTNNSNSNVITMHVLGSITLLDKAYSLTNKISYLFGDIILLNTSLQVYHQPLSSTSSSSTSSIPMGTIQLPTLTLSQDTNVTEFDFITQFLIQDTNALIEFCKDALSSKVVGWKVKGDLPIGVGWLPFDQQLSLDKIIEIEGMDGLKKSELKDIEFTGKHAAGGIALQGTVGVYNPSKTLSMAIGDVNFGIYLPNDQPQEGDINVDQDVMIAVVQAKNTQLIGEKMNYFSVMGRTLTLNDQDPLQKRLMESFLTRYLHGNTSMVHVRGSLFGPDQSMSTLLSFLNQYFPPTTTTSSTTWLEKALSSITLTLPFPGTNQTDIIRSLKLENIKIDYSMISQTPLVSGEAISLLQLPTEMQQISFDVLEIDPNVYLYLDKDSLRPFAQLHPTQPCPSTTIQPGDDDTIPLGMFKVISKVKKAPFKVIPGQEKEYQKFLDKIFEGQESTFYFKGKANAFIENDFGKLHVRDLDFKGELNTKGMQGMKYPPPKVTSMDIIKGHQDALQVKTAFILNNPSNIDMNLGDITFSMLYKGVKIGNVTIDDLNLKSESNNNFDSIGYIFSPSSITSSSSILEFIGDYISGDTIELEISGQNATRSKYLAPLLNQLHFNIQVPIFDDIPLLQHVQMNLLSSTAIIWLRNPFEYINMSILKINATAIYEMDSILGTMYADFKDGGKGWKGPLELPPIQCNDDDNDNQFRKKKNDYTLCNGFTIETPRIPVMLKNKIITWEPISKALGGKIKVAIDSMVTVKIDAFLLDGLDYKRNNITAIIKKSF